MNGYDSHERRSRWHGCGLVLLLPACFHTRYLQDDAGISDDAKVEIDAAQVETDAAGPDAAQCPPAYDIVLQGPSRYRLITAAAPAWEHSDTCASDLRDATHLVILETAAEVASVQALVEHPPATIESGGIWVGGVQLRTATTPAEGWLGFDGQPLIGGEWYDDDATNDHEPNDQNEIETDDHLEQFVAIDAGKHGLNDADGTHARGALCECDGKPMAANAVAAVASNRKP
jgi:hypothetical protein